MLHRLSPEEIVAKEERRRFRQLREVYRCRPYTFEPKGKLCGTCRKRLPLGLFSSTVIKGKRYYHGRCIKCRSTIYRRSKTCKEKRALIDSYRDKPCVDCGQKFALGAMLLIHVRGVKLFPVSQAWNGRSTESIKNEVLKCDVLCCNCERIRKLNASEAKFKTGPTLAELHLDLGNSKDIFERLQRARPPRPQDSAS